MKKEEFLAMSLPYGLIIHFDKYEEITDKMVGMELGTDNKWYCIYDEFGDIDADSVNPILHSLTDLTKPIEHNGEVFTPIIELAKLNDCKNSNILYSLNGRYVNVTYLINSDEGGYISMNFGFSYSNGDFRFYMFNKACNATINNQLILIQKLIEWHFDIAGLIEKREAIDVNTLPENPYK